MRISDWSSDVCSSDLVKNGWEAAVEQVLEGLLQAPLFGDFESRLRNVQAGPKAGIALLSEQMGQGGSGLAAKVSGPKAVLDWLSGLRIAHSAAEADRKSVV